MKSRRAPIAFRRPRRRPPDKFNPINSTRKRPASIEAGRFELEAFLHRTWLRCATRFLERRRGRRRYYRRVVELNAIVDVVRAQESGGAPRSADRADCHRVGAGYKSARRDIVGVERVIATPGAQRNAPRIRLRRGAGSGGSPIVDFDLRPPARISARDANSTGAPTQLAR